MKALFLLGSLGIHTPLNYTYPYHVNFIRSGISFNYRNQSEERSSIGIYMYNVHAFTCTHILIHKCSTTYYMYMEQGKKAYMSVYTCMCLHVAYMYTYMYMYIHALVPENFTVTIPYHFLLAHRMYIHVYVWQVMHCS